VVGTVTVVAKDAFNNTATGYLGTIHISSTDPSATLPPNYTFLVGDSGVKTGLSVTLITAGTQTITATDTVTGTITGSSSSITVNQGPNLFGSTATLIVGGSRSGQVFIAGGLTNTVSGSLVSNTWFYDPASGALTAGPSLISARALHTATAIGSGQILIAGGRSLLTGERELELCSTDAAGTVACANTGGTLAASRCNGAAALFPGTNKVLIAGGDNCSTTIALNTWTIWDAATPTTPFNSSSNPLVSTRRMLTATAFATGKVLLAGDAATATAEVFTLNSGSPGSSTSAATASGMIGVRAGHTATVLASGVTSACAGGSGCVLIAGGNSIAGQTWEIYDPSTNTFPVNATTTGHDLVVAQRAFHAAATFNNGKVLLAGGQNGAGTALSSTEVFNPAGFPLSFSTGSALQVARTQAGAAYTSLQDMLVLIGGSTQAPVTEQAVSP
jgi:hypothetical protein